MAEIETGTREALRRALVKARAEAAIKEKAERKRATARAEKRSEIKAARRKAVRRAARRMLVVYGVTVTAEELQDAEDEINEEGWMEKIVEARFNRESTASVGGRKWRPLAPATIARRGSAHPILQVTGDLMDSAIEGASGTFRARGRIEFPLDDIDLPYAAVHQYGGEHVPARPFYNAPSSRELAPVIKRLVAILRGYARKRAAQQAEEADE